MNISDDDNMKKWITKKNSIIYQILKGRSNSFLISSGNQFIIVDTGPQKSWEKLKRNIDNLVGENQISCLILTHTHYDHSENAAELKKSYNTPIIVHQNEAEYLNRGDSPLPKGSTNIMKFLMNLLGKKFNSKVKIPPASYDIMVDEKYDLSSYGFNGYILHTPGHSPGSMSIIIDDEIAIVGDSMFGVFYWSVYPPFADDIELMANSWKKILNTGCSRFLPGHGSENSRELLQKQYEKEFIKFNGDY